MSIKNLKIEMTGKIIKLDKGILKFAVYEDGEPLEYALDMIDTEHRKWCLKHIGKKVKINIMIQQQGQTNA